MLTHISQSVSAVLERCMLGWFVGRFGRAPHSSQELSFAFRYFLD